MHIKTDGTAQETRVYDDVGDVVHHVVAVQRVGRNTYVTIRYRNADIEGVDGDFSVALPSYEVAH